MTSVLTDWLLTAARLAIHEPTATAVIADPHFGYSEARRKSGDAIPACTLADDLTRLGKALHAQSVRRLVIAGDVVEERWSEALVQGLLDWSSESGIDIVAITPGNHDRGIAVVDTRLPLHPKGFRLGDWLVCHGDRPMAGDKVVQGHIHPCTVVHGRRVPCYLVNADRLVLPAFSLDAAGVNIAGDPRWRNYRQHPISSPVRTRSPS